MKTVRGSGLLASVLTFVYGLYLASYFVWVLVLILTGLLRFAPPVLNSLALAILDTIVYLFLGVGMLRGRRSYFVYAVVWTIWGSLLATFVATYKGGGLNLLSFLIVFFSTYYHVSVNKTNAEVAKTVGQFAGILALIQGAIVTFALASTYMFLSNDWIIAVPPLGQPFLPPTFAAAAVTAVAYLVLGAGMIIGKKDFFFLAVFWAVIESALAVAEPYYTYTHFNVISIFMLAFATYYYFSKTKSR